MNRFDRKYRRIARGISPLDLVANFTQEDLSWDDLFSSGAQTNTTDLFLGKYSRDGIKFMMERFGLDRQARHLDLRKLVVGIDTKDPFRHTLTIYYGGQKDRDHIIMEFVARYQHLIPREEDSEFLYPKSLKVLMIEWLMLQNPKAKFTHRRPRLPGQEYPGLGLGDELMALFTLMGRHLQVEGIINIPEHFHTGLLFSKRFLFLSPHMQAHMTQAAHDLWKKYRLSMIAWAGATGAIVHRESGEPFDWQPRKQIIPLQSQLRQYFKSAVYQGIAADLSASPVYFIDEIKLKKYLENMENPPFRI
ncbi:hypothetical protein HQ531_10030 [bacterium]|nr:hypothetical protein [bacterium]